MKRWGIFILTLAMLFAVAGAEEVFMEESFLDAGVQGEEFFAEESFFGDAFEAEAPEDGAEAEAEDRSVYLFETETRPTTLLPWQNYYIKLEGTPKGKKINLTWSLYNKYNPLEPDLNKAYTEPVTGVKVGKDALAGVKFYIYQVDPWTGVAKEKKTTTGFKASFKVKNPGDYIYYVRLEKVDKANKKEDLGIASLKTRIPVEATAKDYAISKLKINLAYDYSTNYITGITWFDPWIDVYTKKAESSYLVTAKTQTGQLYTGKYEFDFDKKEQNEVFVKGYFGFWMSDVEWDLKEGERAPSFTSEGKKLTITVQPETQYPKAKKASAKLVAPKAKKITANTPPVIKEVQQLSSTSIKIQWYDAAAAAGLVTPTGYTITTNIPGKKRIEAPMAEIQPNYTYNYEKGLYSYVVTEVPETEKVKKYSFSVKANASVKTKKSKAFKFSFLPAAEMSVFDVRFQWDDPYFWVYWKGQNPQVKNFEFYLTDSEHTTEVPVKIISAEKVYDSTKSYEERNYNKFTDSYYVYYKYDEYKELIDGLRLGFVIKAMAEDGVTVLGRVSVEHVDKDDIWKNEIENENYRETDSVVSFLKTAEYWGGSFDDDGDEYAPAPVQVLDEYGDYYGNVTKVSNIRYTDPSGVSTDHTDWDYSDIYEIGKYKITAGIPAGHSWAKEVADADFDFEITKATLKPELVKPEFELMEGESYTISDTDIRVLNGEDREVYPIYFYINKVEVKGVTGNKIEKPGDYKVEVTINADPNHFSNLDSSNELKVELPLKVTKKALYILFYEDGDWKPAEQMGEYMRVVGHGPFNRLNEDDEWRVYDGNGIQVTGSETTVVVKTEDGTEIKEGDIRTAGVYTYEISAKKEGYVSSETATVKVRVYEYKPGEFTPSYGNLSISAETYTQTKLYDGQIKMPDFTVTANGMEVTNYVTSARITDSDGKNVDCTINPGYYEVQVVVSAPGYNSASEYFELYIADWKLELETAELKATGSPIDLYTALTFKATDLSTGKEIPKYNGGTPEICFYISYIYPSTITDPGTYTIYVDAYVEEHKDSKYYHNYASIVNMPFTLTVKNP